MFDFLFGEKRVTIITTKTNTMYEIDKGKSVEDVENGCLIPSDGGQYTKERALQILENGNGGTMREVATGRQFGVSHIKANNQWLRDLLKL